MRHALRGERQQALEAVTPDPLLANMRNDARWPALTDDVPRRWEGFEV